jgi:hypothetical protein
VEEVRGGQRDVDVARFAQRLAPVERLDHGQLTGALLNEPGDPEQVLRPLAVGQRGPARLGGARGLDGGGDIGGAGPRDLGDGLLGGGVERGLEAPGRRVAEDAVDEQAVALGEAHVVGGLGRGGVVPDDGGALLGGHSEEKSSERP